MVLLTTETDQASQAANQSQDPLRHNCGNFGNPHETSLIEKYRDGSLSRSFCWLAIGTAMFGFGQFESRFSMGAMAPETSFLVHEQLGPLFYIGSRSYLVFFLACPVAIRSGCLKSVLISCWVKSRRNRVSSSNRPM